MLHKKQFSLPVHCHCRERERKQCAHNQLTTGKAEVLRIHEAAPKEDSLAAHVTERLLGSAQI